MNKIQSIISGLALATLLACTISCSKFLDVKPKSQIKENALFQNERGFLDALTGVYTQIAQRTLYGDNLTMSFLDVLAQRYKVDKQTSPYWSIANYNYQAETPGINVKSTLKSIWSSFYSNIVNINNLLANMEGNESKFSGDNYNYVKGEALALRAFLHFDLLRLFGPIYSKNPDNLAIPYRTIVSRESQPQLKASQITEYIIKDLLEAEILLKDDAITTGKLNDKTEFNKEFRKHRMNLVAVQGILARVYLYTGNTQESHKYALKVIQSNAFQFVTAQDISASGACRDRTFRNEHLFSVFVNEMKGFTDGYFNSVPTTYENQVLSNDDDIIEDLFERTGSDYRRQYLWERRDGKLLHSKFWQLTSESPNCNWQKNVVPLLRISEIFYIAAETAPSIEEGTEYLNEILIHRGLEPASGIANRQDLLEDIKAEYQKEFFSEGQLFYYYKRHAFTKIPGSDVLADEKVYVLPLPEEEKIFE